MTDPAQIKCIYVDEVHAAIRTLGFDPDDVFALEMNLYQVTIHYQSRYNGKLTGGQLAYTIPIDRKPTP